MALAYAVEQLSRAVTTLASGDEPVAARLQAAWTDHVQMLWQSLYLPVELNDRFKALWERYTAPSDDRQSTKLRDLSPTELDQAVADVLVLAFDTIKADARGEVPMTKP